MLSSGCRCATLTIGSLPSKEMAAFVVLASCASEETFARASWGMNGSGTWSVDVAETHADCMMVNKGERELAPEGRLSAWAYSVLLIKRIAPMSLCVSWSVVVVAASVALRAAAPLSVMIVSIVAVAVMGEGRKESAAGRSFFAE